METFNLASFIQGNYSRYLYNIGASKDFNDICNVKVALIFSFLDDSNCQSMYLDEVFASLSNSRKYIQYDADGIPYLYFYEKNDIIYISADQNTLPWMFRGNLDKFPQIQFILSPPQNEILDNTPMVSRYLDKSVRFIMKTLSHVNQILVSDYFALNANNVQFKVAVNSYKEVAVNSFDDTIMLWFKKSACSHQIKLNAQNVSVQDFISILTYSIGFATLRSTDVNKLVFDIKWRTLKTDYFSFRNEMIQEISKIDSSRAKLNFKSLPNADLKKIVFIVGTEESENYFVFRSIAGNEYVVDESVDNSIHDRIYEDKSTNIVYVNTPSSIDIDYLIEHSSYPVLQFMIVSSYATINTKSFFDYLEEVILTIHSLFEINLTDDASRNMPHICLVVTHNNNQFDYSSVFPYDKYFTTPDPGSPLNYYCASIIKKKLYVVLIHDDKDPTSSRIKDLVTNTGFYCSSICVVPSFNDYTTDQVTEILKYLIVDAGPRDNIDKVIFIVGQASARTVLPYYLAADGGKENDIARLTLQNYFSQGTVFINVPTGCDLSRFFLEDLPLSVQILVCLEGDNFDIEKIRTETLYENLNALSIRFQLSSNTSMVRFKSHIASKEMNAENKIRNIKSDYKFCYIINDYNDHQERSKFMSELMKSENFVRLNRTTKRQDNWIRYQLEIKKMSIDDIVQKYQYSDLEDGISYLSKVISKN